MSNAEQFEAIKSADNAQENKMGNFTAYTMERSAPGQGVRDNQTKTDKLVDSGVLPSFDLMDSSLGFRTGKEQSAKELKDAGIDRHHTKQKDGSNTETDFGNGVKVSSGESHGVRNGHKVETSGSMVEATPPNKVTKDGEVVDPKGRVLAKTNEDGSVTVDTGKGFYTQHNDGTIRKETAIRSRDGKNWEVIDTDSPLGNLRPSDMTKH